MKRLTNHGILKYATIYIFMVSCLTVLSVTGSIVPRKLLVDNAIASTETIDDEGLKPMVFGLLPFRLDNFTDALMINVALGIDESDPFHSVMSCGYHIKNDDRMTIVDGIRNLCGDSSDDGFQPVQYARYWQGYLCILRPMLVFLDLDGIRIFNGVLLFSLLLFIVYVSFRKGKVRVAISFLLSLMIISFWIVPMSMQFVSTFYIAFISIIVQLLYGKPLSPLFYFFIGGLTSYFDLFTTPLITLCLPLIFLIEFNNIICCNKIVGIIKYSAVWAFGYSSVWISKWLLASLFIDYNIYDALAQVGFRTSAEYAGFDMSLIGIIGYISHYPYLLAVLSMLVLAFILFNVYLYKGHRSIFKDNAYLLLIASFPLFWFLIVRNHSVIHCWFVWRILLVTLLSYSLFLTKFYARKT